MVGQCAVDGGNLYRKSRARECFSAALIDAVAFVGGVDDAGNQGNQRGGVSAVEWEIDDAVWSMTSDMVPVVVSICGGAVETSTVWVAAPMASRGLRVRAWLACRTSGLLKELETRGVDLKAVLCGRQRGENKGSA